MAAVLHGATNAWSGYFGMNKLPFDGILTLSAVSVVISIVIVALAGAANLSRSQVRNVLALADGQPDAPRSSAEGVAQAAGSR